MPGLQTVNLALFIELGVHLSYIPRRLLLRQSNIVYAVPLHDQRLL